MKRWFISALCATVAGGSGAYADGAKGLWRTQPDDKGQRALVQSQACGAGGLCGTITAVLDPSGTKIDHPNVGVRLFWDMVEKADGTYQGMAFVPAMKTKTTATMHVSGGEMKVKGCIGPVCKSQMWTRVK